nr:spermidine synthase [Novosphingobium flavum]
MSYASPGEHASQLVPATLPGLDEADEDIHLVSTALLPSGEKLQLFRCGDDFSIQLGDEELMGSTDHVSEEALATMAAERLADRGGSVLIGGLGMGFTLRAALKAWGSDAGIVVAELVPEVLAWAQGPLAHIFGESIADPRVSVAMTDVHDLIIAADELFDAILLDVDNGPDAFVQLANDRLYSRSGLRSASAALRPGGLLAIWSAYPDACFGKELAEVGFDVDEVVVPAYAGSETDMHSLWFARKPDA